MEQRISLVTLGVSDYARAKAFSEALGWSAALDVEETVFFQANGCILVLVAHNPGFRLDDNGNVVLPTA
jgi:uncharacterized protein